MNLNKHPHITDEMKQLLAESENLGEELFEMCDIFRVPVTNNWARYEDGDKNKPIYEAGDFFQLLHEAFERHGWKRPVS